MSKQNDIPLLTDLIESAPEITLQDLGLEDDPVIGAGEAYAQDLSFAADEAAPIAGEAIEISPALEQTVRRILDEHMELAWQEIRLAIQQHLNRS